MNKLMLRKDIEKLRRKYRFDRIDIGSKCEPHTRKWILLLIFLVELSIIIYFLDELDAFFEMYDWSKASAFVIFSLPIAFYLWMWKNHDKGKEIFQKEQELEFAEKESRLLRFNTCMEKIVDPNQLNAIRLSYLQMLEPFLLGHYGIEYELMTLSYMEEILKQENANFHEIKVQFGKNFNWYVQNGMFLFTEFHNLNLNTFHFSGISVKKATFVECSLQNTYLSGKYDLGMFVMCNFSNSIFLNCNFRNTVFLTCNFSNCKFIKCDFSQLGMHSLLDFSDAIIYEPIYDGVVPINATASSLKIIYTEKRIDDVSNLKKVFKNAETREVKNLDKHVNKINVPRFYTAQMDKSGRFLIFNRKIK